MAHSMCPMAVRDWDYGLRKARLLIAEFRSCPPGFYTKLGSDPPSAPGPPTTPGRPVTNKFPALPTQAGPPTRPGPTYPAEVSGPLGPTHPDSYFSAGRALPRQRLRPILTVTPGTTPGGRTEFGVQWVRLSLPKGRRPHFLQG